MSDRDTTLRQRDRRRAVHPPGRSVPRVAPCRYLLPRARRPRPQERGGLRRRSRPFVSPASFAPFVGVVLANRASRPRLRNDCDGGKNSERRGCPAPRRTPDTVCRYLLLALLETQWPNVPYFVLNAAAPADCSAEHAFAAETVAWLCVLDEACAFVETHLPNEFDRS